MLNYLHNVISQILWIKYLINAPETYKIQIIFLLNPKHFPLTLPISDLMNYKKVNFEQFNLISRVMKKTVTSKVLNRNVLTCLRYSTL